VASKIQAYNLYVSLTTMSKIKHVEDMDHNFEIMIWVLMMDVCMVNIIYPIPFDWGFSNAKKIIKFMHINLCGGPMETSHIYKKF
jgi:hypothetical protein